MCLLSKQLKDRKKGSKKNSINKSLFKTEETLTNTTEAIAKTKIQSNVKKKTKNLNVSNAILNTKTSKKILTDVLDSTNLNPVKKSNSSKINSNKLKNNVNNLALKLKSKNSTKPKFNKNSFLLNFGFVESVGSVLLLLKVY